MIERIVLVKLNTSHATELGRNEVAAYTESELSGLPQVLSLTTGVPSDPKSLASWDLLIRLQFANMDDVAAYGVDPTHRAYVDEYLRPKMDVIKAWNFRL